MTPEQFRRLEALYDEAASMEAAARDRFIDDRCAGDEELRRELKAAFGDGGSGLTAVVERAAADAASGAEPWSGRRVGPYRIVRPIGRGGMGTVYLAVRDDDQFHKDVAIKMLAFELGSGTAASRFRQERQILAHLEHANIARLLDGGATDHNAPYIVLEYVAGVPITEWCEQHKLSIEERLRLFRRVCEAVQYAHQHLVVHRDLKPANILVSADAEPKLLDFGIAKLLDAGAGAEALTETATAARMLTPDYASPEQVRGEAVSTATDVYSLGAVLYELLTGRRPHALQNYDAAEIVRAVCDTAVLPPSAAGQRRLRGDVDTIVLKAMQKEPARRYASVFELSEDIRRHLDGLPIAARPDTSIYRASKFVKRHRIGVAATAAVIVALAIGVAVALREARLAQRRFDQVRALANTFLFQFYDQVAPLPGSTAARATIVETARTYLDGLSKDAGNDRDLLLELAAAYQRLGNVQGRAGANLGDLEGARRSYQNAADIYARLRVDAQSPPDFRRRLAGVWVDYARLEFFANHEDVAEAITRRAADLVADSSPDPAVRFVWARAEWSLGESRIRLGHVADGIALLESALRTMVDLQSSGYVDSTLASQLVSTRRALARARVSRGDLDGALSAFQDLLKTTPPCDEHASPAECRELAILLSWTADVYAAADRPNLNEPDTGAALYEQALHIQERLVALDDHDRQARFDLAARFGKLGDAVWRSDPERALNLYKQALATAQTLASKEQLEILHDSYISAILRPLIKLGRTAEARRALSEADESDKVDAGSPYPDQVGDLLWRHQILPSLLLAEGQPEAARRALKDFARDTEALRAGHPDDLTPIFILSNIYRTLASFCSGDERREALLHSAAAWHAWDATTFTAREEQKDLAAANR